MCRSVLFTEAVVQCNARLGKQYTLHTHDHVLNPCLLPLHPRRVRHSRSAPYLVLPSRTAWLSCAQTGDGFYDACGDYVFPNSATVRTNGLRLTPPSRVHGPLTIHNTLHLEPLPCGPSFLALNQRALLRGTLRGVTMGWCLHCAPWLH